VPNPSPPGAPPNVVSAAHALRRHPVFARTSIRHLTDLVELARPDVTVIPFDATEVVSAVFLLLLQGTVSAGPTFALLPGEPFWSGLYALVAGIGMSAASFPSAPTMVGFENDVRLKGTTVGGTTILRLTEKVLLDATLASTSFGLSVDLSPLAQHPKTLHRFFTEKYGRA
jgi:hypothetical protein